MTTTGTPQMGANEYEAVLEHARALSPTFVWSMDSKGDVPELVGQSQDPTVDLVGTAQQFAPGSWSSGELTVDGYRQMFGETITATGSALLWQLSTIEGDKP
jgi:hypothetical protein